MKTIFTTFLLAILIHVNGIAQTEARSLTINETISIALEKSLDAFRNKNMYRSSYWEYRYYKADLLPSLTLDATPFNFNRYRYKDYNFQTQEEEFALVESLGSEVGISLQQNIALTGGRLYLRSDLERIENLGGDNNTQFRTTPISIGYSQDLNGYNEMKWKSKIEPLKFEKAKKQLIQSNEVLAWKAATHFFNLAEAQVDLKIAENRLAKDDTLYTIGKGRFQVGTVTRDALLKLELNFLNAKQSLNKARSMVQRYQSELNSFLTFDKDMRVNCIIPSDIPDLQINANEAIDRAIENNPEMINLKQRILEANQRVAMTKAEAGFNTSIFALYGLDQSSLDFKDAYKEPDNSQRFSVGLQIPLVDWGKRKGRYQMAEYAREAEKASIEQDRIDFEQEIYQDIIDFNLQAEQVKNANLADTVAQTGYEVTLQRFLIGKVDVINLNQARTDLESYKKAYISSIRSYWGYYYAIRINTLYDFINNETLSAEYDKLLQK